MPGQTNNSTILAAENQEIVALNEIRTAIANLSTPTVTVDLSGLETAITTLGVTLSSALEALNMQVTQTNNNCCCSGSGGTTTTPPTTPTPTPGGGQPGAGGPGDPPPPGATTPSGTPQQVAERQCKAAMFVVDTMLIGVAKKLDIAYVDNAINLVVLAGGTVLAGSGVIESIAGALTSIFPPVAVGLFSAAAISAALAVVVNQLQVDFAELVPWLEDNRDILVCALANAQYPLAARIELNRIVNSSSPNLTLGNQLFLNTMIAPVTFDFLFYVQTQLHVLEPELDAITAPCPCGDVDPTETTPTDDYKCKAANYIFDSFTDTVSNWSGFSTMSWYDVANFTLTLGRGLLSNTFAGLFGLIYSTLTAVIPVVISYLGRLYWKGTDYFEALGEVAAQFEANKEAIICELYEAADVAAARAALEVHITDYVGTVMTAHPEWADEQETYINVVTSLLPNAVLNELFKTGAEERAEITNYNPPDFYDCACVEDLNLNVQAIQSPSDCGPSVVTKVGPRSWECQPLCVFGGYYIGVTWPGNYQVTFEVTSGLLTQHPSQSYRPIFGNVIQGYPGNQVQVYSGDSLPPPGVCCNYFECSSGSDYRLTITFGEPC